MNTQKINILIVDDDPTYCKIVSKILSVSPAMADLSMQTAGTLAEGLELLRYQKFDLILLDLGLPDSNGLVTVDKVHKFCADIPIVVQTGIDDEEMGIEAIKRGASDYLIKDEMIHHLLIRTIRYSLERSETEKQLRRERDTAQNYLDTAGVMFVALDMDGRITLLNKKGCQILGCREHEAIGKKWIDNFVPEKDRPKVKTILKRVLAGDTDGLKYVESPLTAADNAEKMIAWSNTLLYDEAGQICGVLSSGTDITQLKETETELRWINERLKEHDRQKNEFIITASHELRTPLAIFKNTLSNAMAGVFGKLNNKLRSELNKANLAVGRLARITSDLVDISKIEADKMDLQTAPLVIQSVITEVLEMLRFLVDDNNMVLDVSMPEGELLVNADHDKMIQVFSKLVENATKFVPNCGGRILVRVEDFGDIIKINIEDNGSGIQGTDINRVFDRFVQFEKIVGEGDHGLGLGLAITKELVEMHGGRIWVENVPTGGANFSIVLPKYCQQSEPDKKIDFITTQIDQLTRICSEGSQQLHAAELLHGESMINWTLALRYCKDEDTIRRIAETILKNGPQYIASIDRAITLNRPEELLAYADDLKQITWNLGVTRLTEKINHLEQTVHLQDLTGVMYYFTDVKAEFDKLADFLSDSSWLETVKKQNDTTA